MHIWMVFRRKWKLGLALSKQQTLGFRWQELTYQSLQAPVLKVSNWISSKPTVSNNICNEDLRPPIILLFLFCCVMHNASSDYTTQNLGITKSLNFKP